MSEDVIADVCATEYMRSRDSDEVTVMGTRVLGAPDGWYVVEALRVALSTRNADKVMETTDGVVLGIKVGDDEDRLVTGSAVSDSVGC